MLTLYHAPLSRSSRILTLLDELGALDKVDVKAVTIPRQDGSGGRDPNNPHPEGKVPYLVHDGVGIRESNAIMQYLCELFPKAGLAPQPGDATRGAFLAWMAWYGNVMEPVLVMNAVGVENPLLAKTFGGTEEMTGQIETALSKNPYLLGDTFTAADLIVVSAYLWMPQITPDIPVIRDWIERCGARASLKRTQQRDTATMAA